MGWSYDTLITELTSRYGQANLHRGQLNLEITQATADWNLNNDHACLQDVIQGMQATLDYMVDMLAKGFHSYNGSSFTLPDALDRSRGCPFITEAPEFELTMAVLINTMLTANPAEVEYFVGLVDAYRQSIWNQPFNEEFFAALARGFEQWD